MVRSAQKRTQGESEKVTEYLADLKLLAKKAYPDGSDEIRTHLVMQAFLEGLFDQNVRLELRKEKHTDLDAALQRAVYLEAIYRLEQQDTPGVSSKLINNSPVVASIDTLDKALVCYGCNHKGHTKGNCSNCWSCGSTSHTRRYCPHNFRR